MTSVPYGYLTTVLVSGVATGLVVLAPRRPRCLGGLASWASVLVCELTIVMMLWLTGSTALLVLQDGVDTVASATGVGATVVVLAALARELVLSARAGAVMQAALADTGLVDPSSPASGGGWVRALRSLLFPLPLRPQAVDRRRGLSYGSLPHQKLDVYDARSSSPLPRPVLVQLHGGGFVGGRRSKESLSLLYLLARQGWFCVSADYRLASTPAEGHPDSLVDVKLLLAWLRTEGHRIGADPSTLVMVGTSAGAHLSAMAALTAGEPRYQPGFESVDTSISGFVGFAGYYGPLSDERDDTSPFDHLRGAESPPGLVVHGSRDTQTSPSDARLLVHRLRAQSTSCGFALLPGAHHTFDLLDSVRFRSVRIATAAFCRSLLDRDRTIERSQQNPRSS
jgi:acetyl esterase/lipase